MPRLILTIAVTFLCIAAADSPHVTLFRRANVDTITANIVGQ